MDFLIAYDIADPRRLRRVARFFEKRAVRCQKSVFLFRGSPAGVGRLLDDVGPLLDPADDCVQAWQLTREQPPGPTSLGMAATVRPAAVVVAANGPTFVPPDRMTARRTSGPTTPPDSAPPHD